MELKGEREIPASQEATWNALNDPETLKACVPGCETMDQTGENEYEATMKFKIGPVNARFKGKLNLENVMPRDSYTIRFEGQGGVAGFGKGTADVSLESIAPDKTLLRYEAKAQVGGKIAQIGSRLVSSAAAKVADDFFKRFAEHLSGGRAA